MKYSLVSVLTCTEHHELQQQESKSHIIMLFLSRKCQSPHASLLPTRTSVCLIPSDEYSTFLNEGLQADHHETHMDTTEFVCTGEVLEQLDLL